MAVRIGFVGTGGIAKVHMDALGKVPDAQVVACMDVDADRAAEAAARFAGAGAYTEVGVMLDRNELDALYICVPPHAHGEAELAAIERGIPFFVEKPIGNDRETPLQVLSALEGADVVTSVGYMMRYRDSARRAKEYLEAETPVLAWGTYVCSMPGAPWWRRKEQSGGQVNEQSTHIFDLARYLLGEVTSAFCVGRRGLITDVEGYSVEDASICTLTFESGLICEISSSCAVSKGEMSLDILTRNGRARLEGWGLDLTLSRENETRKYTSADEVFLLEDRTFLQAVQTGDASAVKSPYADAVKTQMVTCAANESMESGQPVSP